MSVTQIVEEALRAYQPAGIPARPSSLVRKGPLLVVPASSRKVSHEEVEAALEAMRREGR
ncbi:MAG: hypothetical protein ACK4K7_07225 [Allosphingosinicella sp.]|uniref:hypothetical protein n=1 Tax=Allosphingosinicella sp. TaxID=2823234 RepID=UPI00395624D5